VKDTIFNSKISLNCQGILHEFDKPIIMGIINTTPDSFYEGSRKPNIDAVLEQANIFINQGVDIIDIGGYSSRPGAKDISEQEELERIITAIELIRKNFPNILISIDTFRPKVAKEALNSGANIINDITGGQFDSAIYKIAAQFSAPYIMMHMKGTPQNMQSNTTYKNLITDIIYFFSKQLKLAHQNGVKDIIIDPGLGFSKTIDQNYDILRQLDLFKVLEKPILIGASRKSMIYKLLNIDSKEALNGTTVLNTIALINGAQILRVHDVKEAVEVKTLYSKINIANL
jgi:dihydropteroate synthase